MIALLLVLACTPPARDSGVITAGSPVGPGVGSPTDALWQQILTDDVWPRTAGDQHHPTQARAADGASAVLWDEQDGAGSRVAIRAFDPAGQALGEPEALAVVGGQFARPDAVAVADGYLVTWHTRFDVFVGKTDRNGVPVGAPTQVNTVRGVDPDKGQPDIAVLADGSALVAYHFADPAADPISAYYTRRFSSDLQPLSDEVQIAVSTEVGSPPDALAMPDGGWLVAWSTRTLSQATIQLSRYDAAGAEQWTRRADQSPEYETCSRPNLALGDDGFAVAWRVQSPAAVGLGAYGRLYDLDGAPRTAPFLLPDSAQRGNVAAGPGLFLYTWEPSAGAVLAMAVDSLTGEALESPWEPLPGATGQQHGAASFHPNGDGSHAVLFTADAGNAGSRSLVRALWRYEP